VSWRVIDQQWPHWVEEMPRRIGDAMMGFPTFAKLRAQLLQQLRCA
jgi:hypothetical protein